MILLYIALIYRGDIMKMKNGFTLFEKTSEIGPWLKKQNVTRIISRLQVHHMDLPNYDTWEKTDKKVFNEPYFGRTQSLNDYGRRTWNYSDGHGKYIAQHFNVFPDGKITTGRHLNSKPIGIRGWNDGAICIEIYGDFDKGKDVITKAQKEAVIALYGELCKRFDIPVNTAHIRPHCWFTAGGTYLGKYDPNRSAKTCPGTNFMGYGCSPSGFAKFINEVKAYVNGREAPIEEHKASFKQYIAKPTVEGLVCRKGPGIEYDKVTMIDPDIAITIVDEEKAKDGGTWLKCKSGYYVNKKYMKFIRYA